MPKLVYKVGEICLREQQDIVFLTFGHMGEEDGGDPFTGASWGGKPMSDVWESMPSRKEVIHWLGANDIGWEECFYIYSGTIIAPYEGAIYVDVPPDKSNEKYNELLGFLEDEKGGCVFSGVDFLFLSYEGVLKTSR
ncbi:hypothetical protein ACFQH5_11010 [Halomonas salifodinae]|uniref:Uncharacterized protein n=1 Tax=Halomonas salifodinae TaxID=438745 RepID=A0ABW2EYS6_9GAMM